ncbi:MAG: hypothetical protein NC124_13635 [Clostridium sp.]|nr:hypothetical protein [Roseburia sp.]MCM1432121.1 hypothetical protein [Muribaculaceae bacterium]MCM1499503.1 hypothetical protein [Clostridium sp.]
MSDTKSTLCIISCFDCYQSRTRYIEKFYGNKGYAIVHLISDFDHGKKIHIKETRENAYLVHVPGYKRNLSIRRIYSHYAFARAVYKEVQQIKPDIIYCMIPPNFLVKKISKYKKRNFDVKLIYDVYDLWPESILKPKSIYRIPYVIWKYIRDKDIGIADYVLTECGLYQNILKGVLKTGKKGVLYATEEDSGRKLEVLQDMREIHLCYIGTINHIIDVDSICRLIIEIGKRKPVVLHIIGLGENKEKFIKMAERAGADVIDYGPIYESGEKYRIFSKCHFGLNMMKKSVCVGLTLKSLSYFEAGLPILNNIPADTSALVSKYQAGFNIIGKDEEIKISEMDAREYQILRENTEFMFQKEFSERRIMQHLSKLDKALWSEEHL